MKIIVILSLFISISMITIGQNIQKCPAYPDTIEMVQINGYKLKCFIKGECVFFNKKTI